MKLLLTGAFKYSENQLNILEENGCEVTFIQNEIVPLQIDVSDFQGVVCNNLFLYNDIKKFEKLKFIQLTSAGLDRVPLDYIRNRGIQIYNAQDVYSIPIAEWVVLKILEIYKMSVHFYRAQFRKNWEKQRNLLELTDKTAAIIGFGSVGSEVAKRLKAFGVKVIGVGKREIKSEIIDEYYKIDKLDEVLRKSDIVILTVPLTSETTHLLNSTKIEKMKNNSVLINVSRGGVIDEDSLLEALKGGKFLGVSLDVFKEEPLPQQSKLWDIERVIITPHNSFLSDGISERMFKVIIRNVSDFNKG